MELYLRSSDAQNDVDINISTNNLPPIIPLRLPASLLSNLSSESRINITANNGVGDVSPNIKLTVTNQGGDGGSDNIYPLEVSNNQQCIDYYQSTAASASASASAENTATTSNKKELHSIGKSNKQYTLKPKSKADLKEIGKKTRRLLEEERKKRKEIVRLDDNDLLLPPPGKKKKKTVEEKTVVSSTKKSANKPKSTSTRKRKQKVPSNIDGWMPNVDDLQLSSPTTIDTATTTTNTNKIKDDHSNSIRLHGLPLGVKPEHIRKFFHGLNPSLIFVLPSFDQHIQGWDATGDNAYDGRKAVSAAVVERHKSDFRVYVKFASAPVAVAALERSGESIGLDKGSNSSASTSLRKEIAGVTISLSPVPKAVATFLLKNMVMHTRKGESILDTMNNAQKRLGTVNGMIWPIAIKELRLKHKLSGKRGKRGSRQFHHLSQEYTHLTNKLQYQTMAKTYNPLVDTHEKLEVDSSLLLTHTFDPSCLEDSVHRITQFVSNWLLDEIYLIERLLKEFRNRKGIL